ncbi:MAG: hypothetical protein ABUL72_05355, partial [Armatimonadota bacterium]
MEGLKEQEDTSAVTRRDFGKWMVALFGSSYALLSGCGGSWSGVGKSSGGSTAVNATIAPPSGVLATDLVVTSSQGTTKLTSTSFTTSIAADFPTLMMALHSGSSKVVAMAMADPTGAAPRLDSTSTAIALIYLGLGGAMLSGVDRRNLLAKVSASTEVSGLASAIATAQATDKFALSNGNATLKAKLQSAIRAVGASLTKSVEPEAATTRATGIPPQLLIEPSAEVDGMTMVQTSSGIGFQVQNKLRRSGTAYTYIVGHVAEDGSETTENPPKAVGAPLYVPMTRNILSLPYGWAQVTSSPVTLSLAGRDSKTKFQTVVVTTAFNGTTPAIYADTRYYSAVQTWKDEAKRLRQTGILQGVANMVLEVMGLGGTLFEYSTLSALIPTVLAKTTSLRAGLLAAAEGNVFYEFVLQELLKEFTVEALFALELPIIQPLIAQVNALRAAELFAGQSAAATMAFIRAGLVALIVLGVFEVADVVAVAHDTHGGSEADVWNLTAFQPVVQLTPKVGNYVPGGSLTISVSAPGIGAQGLTYKWTLAGSSLANLSDGTQVGTSFTSTKSTVNLATTPSTVGELSVTVTVFKNGVEVGTVVGKYTIAEGLVIKFQELAFGPRYQYPAGGGYWIAYMEVPLDATKRTKVKMHVVNNHPSYQGATAE